MVDNDLLNIILNIDNWNDDIVVDPNRNQHFNAFIDFCENIENLCKVESDVSKSDSIKIFTLKLYVMFLYDDKLKETYDTQLRGFLKQVKLDINQKSLCISETSFVIDAIAVLEKAKNSSYVSNHERSEGIKLFFNALQNMLKYSNEKGYIVTLIQKVNHYLKVSLLL